MTLSISDIRFRKEERKKALKKDLRRIKKQRQDMGAQRIILFGSYAHGHVRSWSDLDIICVMPPTRSSREWTKKIYDEIEREVDCDILAYTSEELEMTVPVSRFLRHALKTGRVIYERRP